MIYLHEAIRVLNPSIIVINGTNAYNENGDVVQYDLAAAQAKLAEMQAAEVTAQQAQATAKASALAKLTALGLTQAEVTALIG